MDRSHSTHIPGHEPNASLRYRVVGQLWSSLLATYDDGIESRNIDGIGNYTYCKLRSRACKASQTRSWQRQRSHPAWFSSYWQAHTVCIQQVSDLFFLALLTLLLVLDIDMNLKTDRELYQTAQKLLAIIMSFGQACVYVFSGLYGPPSELGLGICVLL